MEFTNGITKPSLTRIARRAGVKSVSECCYNTIRDIIVQKLTEIIKISIIVNSQHQTKTLMSEDIYKSLQLLGYNVAQSSELGTTTCSK